MAKIWDALMKMLVSANPQDFVSFLTQGTYYQGDVTNELIIRSVDADFLCQAKQNEQEIIVHAEYQRRRDQNDELNSTIDKLLEAQTIEQARQVLESVDN